MTDKRQAAPASVWRNPVHFLAFGFGSGAITSLWRICGDLRTERVHETQIADDVVTGCYRLRIAIRLAAGQFVCGDFEVARESAVGVAESDDPRFELFGLYHGAHKAGMPPLFGLVVNRCCQRGRCSQKRGNNQCWKDEGMFHDRLFYRY